METMMPSLKGTKFIYSESRTLQKALKETLLTIHLVKSLIKDPKNYEGNCIEFFYEAKNP